MVKKFCNECGYLSNILGDVLDCVHYCIFKDTPSYFDKYGKASGCLVAHLNLSLLEVISVENFFKTPIYNTISSFHKDIANEYDEDKLWLAIILTIYIHDIGKLTNEYRCKERGIPVPHHYVSAITAKDVFNVISNNEKLSCMLSLSVLFHHEALDWKRVERGFLEYSLYDLLFDPYKKIQYSIDENVLCQFKKNCQKLLYQIKGRDLISQHQYNYIKSSLEYSIEILIKNSGKRLNLGEKLCKSKARRVEFIAPALAIYRLLYMVDNRAASARTTYWRTKISNIDWNKLKDISEKLVNELSKTNYYIALSAISNRI